MGTTMKLRESYQLLSHPGIILKEELTSRQIKQKDFATLIHLQPSHLSEIIKGKRPITEQIAQALEMSLDIPAQFWINVQTQYDKEQLDITRLGKAEIEASEHLKEFNQLIDIKTLMKYYGLNKNTNAEQWSFCESRLGFTTVSNLTSQLGMYHRSEKTGMDNRMINTWSVMAREAVSNQSPCGTYNKNNDELLKQELFRIFHENKNTIERLRDTFSKYGIRFEHVKKVEHASIDGYSFISDNGIPSIVVTIRFNRIDNLAFAVMHEFGHIHLNHLTDNSRAFINVAEEEYEPNKEEEEANLFAVQSLIPDYEWKDVPYVSPNPFIIQQMYSNWAEQKHLNKWIVLGRLSHETGMYKFNSDDSRFIA